MWHESTRERWFWKRVQKSDTCWIWTGIRHRFGHGRFAKTIEGKRRWIQAHRYAYELLIGPIPDGLTIDHLCKNPPCVNPAHLEPVTLRENVLRSDNAAMRNARKSSCPKGHPFTEDNLLSSAQRYGQRVCRICARSYQREYYYRHKRLADDRITLESIGPDVSE